MKLEINNLKDFRECPHCFCIDSSVRTGSKFEKYVEAFGDPRGSAIFSDVYSPHKECCNCGATKLK